MNSRGLRIRRDAHSRDAFARNLNSARFVVPFPAGKGPGEEEEPRGSQGAINAYPRWRATTFNARPPRVYVPRVPEPAPLPRVRVGRTDVSRGVEGESIPDVSKDLSAL